MTWQNQRLVYEMQVNAYSTNYYFVIMKYTDFKLFEIPFIRVLLF